MMIPKLFSFDLDGTLLDSEKRIRPSNAAAIREMRNSGAVIALASGRLASAMRPYVPELGGDAMIIALNGAEIFTGAGADAKRIHYAPLGLTVAERLINYCKGKPLAVNFYYNDSVYTVKTPVNTEWTEVYRKHIGVEYVLINDFDGMSGVSPAKIILIGAASYIDELENYFRSLWSGEEVYICRTWDHFLEFMNPAVSKGAGLRILCDALGIGLTEAAAYGDADNDIPMIEAAGLGVAMRTASPKLMSSAVRSTELSNDDDWVRREWELIRGVA